MPQTRQNGVQTPTNSDAYNLTADLATLADGVRVFKCASQAARDALTGLSAGDIAIRNDLAGVLEVYDGAAWQRGSGSVAPAAGSGWALAGTLVRTRGTAGNQVSAAFMCTYSGGAFSIGTSFTLALTLNNPGYIPTADVFGYVLVLSSANVPRADGAFNINSSGQIYIRMFSGSYSVQPTDKFFISANWNA